MKKRTPLTLLAASAALMLALTGCSNGQAAESTESGGSSGTLSDPPKGDELTTTADPELTKLLPKDITDKGRIDIAVSIPSPPTAMYDTDNRMIGFDPELGRLLGQKLGIDVSLNKQAFDSVIPSLQAKKHDIIMSGMNDTPERQKTLTFVNYWRGGFAIGVKAGNPDNIKTQKDLCGKTVSVQKATVQGEILRAMDCDINIMELPAELDAQTALRAGKSQAWTTDGLVAEYAAATTGDGKVFEIVRDPENPAGFNPVYSGIGILKDRTELIDAVQKGLQALIDEGTYAKVLERSNMTAYGLESAELNQGAKIE